MGTGTTGRWWGGGTTGGSPLWGIGIVPVSLVLLAGIGSLRYRGLVGGMLSSTTVDRALEERRVANARGDLSDGEFEERRAKVTEVASRGRRPSARRRTGGSAQ